MFLLNTLFNTAEQFIKALLGQLAGRKISGDVRRRINEGSQVVRVDYVNE